MSDARFVTIDEDNNVEEYDTLEDATAGATQQQKDLVADGNEPASIGVFKHVADVEIETGDPKIIVTAVL